MPANTRDRKVLSEAQYFCKSKATFPRNCNHHKPTLEELQAHSFSDYVRKVILPASLPKYEDKVPDPEQPNQLPSINSDDRPLPAKLLSNMSPQPFGNGMAKVTLPKGWMEGEGVDPTGRGPEWQKGTELGDMVLPSPIKQVLRGIGGIYEYTFLDLPPITAAEFREKADEFLKSQVGANTDMSSIELLQRKFWKRLGPTMQPALYGADIEGTLFRKDHDCNGWNISKLNSCLELLLCDQPDNHQGGIPGVTTPYLYFGMWASIFCAHTEDMNLLSINYLHAGAPKVWYAVAAGEDSKRLEQLCEGHYHQAKSSCPEYMRHKRSLISPTILKNSGIPFTTTVQYPGDAIITFPGSYHFGFNTGFNVAEATNFAVPEWLPYGKRANICLCRPDSVRIDMNKFERLLLQYEREVEQSNRLTCRDWAIRLRKKRKEEELERQQKMSSRKSSKENHENEQRMQKEFWVEVMDPLATKSQRQPLKGSRKRSQQPREIWHLAKPVIRKLLRPPSRVLCIVPIVVDSPPANDDISEEEDDEQCFAGTIIEVRDDHVRIRFDGMGKKEDNWMPVDSPKLFLDGGRWGEDVSQDLPALHYWREEDSKRRCV